MPKRTVDRAREPTLTASLPQVSLRLDIGAGDRIGPGKIALLEAVARTGSISAAARALGMSYRRAWQLVDALNRMFDTAVVSASTGGPKGGGATLSPFGESLVATYRTLEEQAQSAAEQALQPFTARLAGGRDHTRDPPRPRPPDDD